MDKSSGVITTTSNSFDADITTGGVEYYDIVVRAADGRATDSDRRFIVETIRVTLSDVNDNTPAFAETLVHVVIPETDLPGVFYSHRIQLNSYMAVNSRFLKVLSYVKEYCLDTFQASL